MRFRIAQWIPRRTKHRDKTAFESPNQKIWISWGGYPVRFHLQVSRSSFMWMEKGKE